MALNKRETLLAWGVGSVALLLALDLLVIEPYFAQRVKLDELRGKDATEELEALKVRRQERETKAKWTERRSQGLEGDSKDAERQMLGALNDWAGETGIVLKSVKPEYIESKKELREITVQATASGGSDAMIKFLFKLQTAKFPVRVTEMQLGSRNDSEELAIQLRISTLYLTQEKKDNGGTKRDSGKKVANQ